MSFADIEERAAIMEYCGGKTRFQAETDTALELGKKRWELFGADSKRNSARGGNSLEQTRRDTTSDLPAMQSHAPQQAGQVLVGFVSAGWGGLEVLALLVSRGAVL